MLGHAREQAGGCGGASALLPWHPGRQRGGTASCRDPVDPLRGDGSPTLLFRGAGYLGVNPAHVPHN